MFNYKGVAVNHSYHLPIYLVKKIYKFNQQFLVKTFLTAGVAYQFKTLSRIPQKSKSAVNLRLILLVPNDLIFG